MDALPTMLNPFGIPFRIDSKVEYIEAHDGQVIDTGIPITADTIIQARWYQTGNAIQQRLFGVNDGGGNAFACYINNDSKWAVNTGTSAGGAVGSAPGTKLYQGTFDLGTGDCQINTSSRSNGGTPFTSTSTIPIFQRRNSGVIQTNYPATMQLYWFKIWQGDNLVMDGIPVRTGGTGYLFDQVRKILLGNCGTGSFLLGSDIS